MANYTKPTPQELLALLYQYDLGEVLSVAPLDGGQANSSIKVTTGKGQFTLSICDEKNAEDIQNLTDILVNLEDQNFPTTRLIKTKEGRNFVFHGEKPAYIKRFLEGRVTNELEPKMLKQVGQAMASLHSLKPLDSMKPSFPYGINVFDSLLESGFNHEYLDWLAEKKTYLEQAIDPAMPKGFIHGDIFWDNLLFENGSLVAILDFEEACYYYKLFDHGMAAVGCCSGNGRFNISHIKELLAGYAEHCPFTSQEKSQLNIFIEYSAVAASFWRFRQYNIRYPGSPNKESYRELAALADQIHAMKEKPLLI